MPPNPNHNPNPNPNPNRGQLSRHLKGNEQNEVSRFSAELRKIEEKDKVMENLYAVLSNQRSSQSFADVLQKGSS